MAKRSATSTASKDGADPATPAPTTDAHATVSEAPKMTPAAALARHIEWLEYALGAARAEQAARAVRVEKATRKNRDKRTNRLAEATDEVAELTALLAGIHDLQAKARGPRPRKPAPPRGRSTSAKTTGRRRPATATPGA